MLVSAPEVQYPGDLFSNYQKSTNRVRAHQITTVKPFLQVGALLKKAVSYHSNIIAFETTLTSGLVKQINWQ